MKKPLLFLCLIFTAFLSNAQNSSNCLIFDGTDDHAIVPNASMFIAGSRAFTITCWVYPTNANPVFPDYDGFCGIRNNVDADFYMVEIGGATVEARFRNDQGVAVDIVDNTMQLNTWNHYAFVYSEPELTLYRNGVPIQTKTATGTISNMTEAFYMGDMLYSGTHYWLTGKLDEVSLWNRAVGGSELLCMLNNSIRPSSDSLKLYYDFNQGVAAGANPNDTLLIDRSLHMDASIRNFALSGFTSNFVPGVNPYPTTFRQLCPGDSIDFNGQTITSAGNYSATYQAGQICDSTAILTVAVTDTSVNQNGQTLIANQAGALYQWVDCNNNNAPISGATSRSFTPSGDGNYAVQVTQGSCVALSGCHYILINGIKSLTANAIVAFPNPVSDQLTIRLNAPFTKGEITVTDPSGKIVYQLNNVTTASLTVPTSDWSAGVYFIAFKSDNSIQKLRIVRQ